MPFRTKQSKESQSKTGKMETDHLRANQMAERRRQEMATRSTLSRLRNRNSDWKYFYFVRYYCRLR